MATWILVNIGSGNGLLPDGTKPLPEPLLTDHQWSPVAFILGQFHKRCLNCQWQKIRLKITCLKFYSNFPGANVLKHGEVITSHGILWNIITYPCPRYMFLVVASHHQYRTLWMINSNDILLNSSLKYQDGITTITIINNQWLLMMVLVMIPSWYHPFLMHWSYIFLCGLVTSYGNTTGIGVNIGSGNGLLSGPWFDIKMPSYQYRKYHCGDKTVVRSAYLHNGISYTGKMASLYWTNPLMAPNHYLNHCWLIIS